MSGLLTSARTITVFSFWKVCGRTMVVRMGSLERPFLSWKRGVGSRGRRVGNEKIYGMKGGGVAGQLLAATYGAILHRYFKAGLERFVSLGLCLDLRNGVLAAVLRRRFLTDDATERSGGRWVVKRWGG